MKKSFHLLFYSIIIFLALPLNKIFAQEPVAHSIASLKSRPGFFSLRFGNNRDSISTTANKPGGNYFIENPVTYQPPINSSQNINSYVVTGAFTLTIDTIGTSCGYNNGSIVILASGGVAPYLYTFVNVTYSYSRSQNTGNFQRVSAGLYDITVTDATGQVVKTSLTLSNVLSQPYVTAAPNTYPSGCNTFDGQLTMTASGGLPPYQYSLDVINYQSGNVFSNLSPGAYRSAVKDANGCIYVQEAHIFLVSFNFSCFSIGLSGPSASCNNSAFLVVTADRGIPPYEYSLDGINYQVNNVLDSLAAGLQTVYVKDSSGVVNSFTVGILSNCNFNISSVSTDASCKQNDASLTITASNGAAPYTYSIDGANYQTGNTFTGLAPGNYTVNIKDANGLMAYAYETIFDNCPIVTAITTDEICSGKNGTITATGNQGTMPYQFSIDGINFQTSNIFTGLSAGNYAVTIKDANDFTNTTAVTVNGNCIQLTVAVANTFCSNSNGSLTATATNGIAPYQYSIDGINFQTGNVFTGLTAGNYVITVKDANAATKDSIVTIADSPAPQLSVAVTQASCSNTNGSITIIATGGAAPLQYSIDNGNNFQSNNIFTNLDSGYYVAMVKDANACTSKDTIQVTAPPIPRVFLGNDTTLCVGKI